jgi:uncharacterized protein (UPF0210 family)
MNIRTITTGFNLKIPFSEKQIERISEVSLKIKKAYEKSGYKVQTVRIATQPWEKYNLSKEQLGELVVRLEKVIEDLGIDYFNIGTTREAKNISLLLNLFKKTKRGFCSVMVCDNKIIDHEAARSAARLMKQLSTVEANGFANLRFAAIFNTQPGNPFFPAAYHKGPTAFGIGTENSDLVYKAFSLAKKFEQAEKALKGILTAEYKKIEKIALRMSRDEKIKYSGIDVSIASSVKREKSIAFAFEKLGLGRFGEAGTLAVAKIITETLNKLPVKKCGYSGLMLPVLEDFGLAKRNDKRYFNLNNLLLYSAVCGTGLDTIPLPGDISEKKLYALLLDIASLAIKLDKPLSARLMPVPGKKAGEKTEFSFGYFVNTKIMDL